MSKLKLSPAKQRAEIKKCFEDPLYFINNYCKIPTTTQGLITFKTFHYQDDLILKFEANRYNIVLKARQLGISTLTAAYATWLLVFKENKSCLVLATKVGTASNLVMKVADMYQHLPDWLKITKIKIDNRQEFRLTNGSFIKAESTERSSGRSEALSLLIIDEAAHVSNLDGENGLWTSISPTISRGGRCIVISTPAGQGNWYYNMYMGAEAGSNNFVPTKLMWWEHPDCDEEWLAEETKNMTPKQVAQEYLCSFNASGDTVVDPEVLTAIEEKLDSIEFMESGYTKKFSEPVVRSYVDRNLFIWEPAKPEGQYFITVDVARGDGADFSTAMVWDMSTMSQAAEYKGQIAFDVFTDLLLDICKNYNNPPVLVESNMLGHAVLTRMEEVRYPKIIYTKRSTGEWSGYYYNDGSCVPGFYTSGRSRPEIVALMEEQVRNEIWTIRSKRLLAELRTFIWDSGKPQAQRGQNDDLVMSFCLACWGKENVFFASVKSEKQAKAALSSIKKDVVSYSSGAQGPLPIFTGPHITNRRKSIEKNLAARYKGLLD